MTKPFTVKRCGKALREKRMTKAKLRKQELESSYGFAFNNGYAQGKKDTLKKVRDAWFKAYCYRKAETAVDVFDAWLTKEFEKEASE